jgi:hypothetical protein
MNYARYTSQSGITTLLVIGFMGVFMLIVGTITSYALEQGKYGRALYSREQALSIAEAGLENFRWLIAHNTNAGGTIMSNGTGLGSLPTTYTVTDPESGTLGSAAITATPTYQCGAVQWMDLTSKGTSNAGVGFPRTLTARYMKRSVAEYAFLYNSTVWFGSTNIGVGPYHANNGMRMDGTTNSTVTAGVSTVICDSSLNCSPSSTQNGVFGNSTMTSLWQYPVSTIDFSGMAVNFSTLRSYAITSGVMLNPTSVTRAGVTQGSTFASVGADDTKGFHLIFKSNGTVDVYRVTATNPTNSIQSYNNIVGDYYFSYPLIVAETLVANVSVPSTCALIYSQAKTWIEGTVSGKVTLIAADPGSYNPDIILNNNISYATTDGTTGLTAVAEDSIMLGLKVPDSMSVRGIFVAQSGFYGRDHYIAGWTNGNDSYITRSTLTVAGTIVSNLRGAVWWGSSGFATRYNYYDRVLAFSPPPFTPAVTTDYSLQLWREQ